MYNEISHTCMLVPLVQHHFEMQYAVNMILRAGKKLFRINPINKCKSVRGAVIIRSMSESEKNRNLIVLTKAAL